MEGAVTAGRWMEAAAVRELLGVPAGSCNICMRASWSRARWLGFPMHLQATHAAHAAPVSSEGQPPLRAPKPAYALGLPVAAAARARRVGEWARVVFLVGQRFAANPACARGLRIAAGAWPGFSMHPLATRRFAPRLRAQALGKILHSRIRGTLLSAAAQLSHGRTR